MAALMVQAGAGVYARLQGGADGAITVEFGNIAGGCFYPAHPARRVHAACWDGQGWLLAAVDALVQALRPSAAVSAALEADLHIIRTRMSGELRETLRLPSKAGEDWLAVARMLRALARGGRLPQAALRRFADDRGLPRVVREAALDELAAVEGV